MLPICLRTYLGPKSPVVNFGIVIRIVIQLTVDSSCCSSTASSLRIPARCRCPSHASAERAQAKACSVEHFGLLCPLDLEVFVDHGFALFHPSFVAVLVAPSIDAGRLFAARCHSPAGPLPSGAFGCSSGLHQPCSFTISTRAHFGEKTQSPRPGVGRPVLCTKPPRLGKREAVKTDSPDKSWKER